MAVDPVRAEAGLKELIKAYRDAQRVIVAQIKASLLTDNLERRIEREAALQKVVNLLNELGVATSPGARQLIENAWNEGDDSVVRSIGKRATGYEFSAINREALQAAQDALVMALDTERTTVAQQVSNMYRRAGQRAVARGLLGASGSRRAVSKDLKERLAKKQITAFVDRAGRVWDIDRYTEMVARTATRQAVVDAQIQRMASAGIELARVNTNGSKCPICGPQEGVLVSIGSARSFDGEAAASLDSLPSGGPPFHPNCKHWLDPVAEMFA